MISNTRVGDGVVKQQSFCMLLVKLDKFTLECNDFSMLNVIPW